MTRRVEIYVREGDKELWEKARKLAAEKGSLSMVVADALREYLTQERGTRTVILTLTESEWEGMMSYVQETATSGSLPEKRPTESPCPARGQ